MIENPDAQNRQPGDKDRCKGLSQNTVIHSYIPCFCLKCYNGYKNNSHFMKTSSKQVYLTKYFAKVVETSL